MASSAAGGRGRRRGFTGGGRGTTRDVNGVLHLKGEAAEHTGAPRPEMSPIDQVRQVQEVPRRRKSKAESKRRQHSEMRRQIEQRYHTSCDDISAIVGRQAARRKQIGDNPESILVWPSYKDARTDEPRSLRWQGSHRMALELIRNGGRDNKKWFSPMGLADLYDVVGMNVGIRNPVDRAAAAMTSLERAGMLVSRPRKIVGPGRVGGDRPNDLFKQHYKRVWRAATEPEMLRHPVGVLSCVGMAGTKDDSWSDQELAQEADHYWEGEGHWPGRDEPAEAAALIRKALCARMLIRGKDGRLRPPKRYDLRGRQI